MSDEQTEQNTQSEVSVEDKIKMLQDWIALINKDIDAIQTVREYEFGVYREHKARYDKYLAKRYKVVSRLDKRINERKKSIAEIEAEMEAIRNRPPPGVLPEIVETDEQRKRRVKKVAPEPVVGEPAVDLSTVQLSPDEIAALQNEIQSSQ